jgi:tetratricopeptide (TPR) repeat protein
MEAHALNYAPDDPGNAEAKRLVEQGRQDYQQGELREALSCLHRAYGLFKADGDQGQIAETANDIGVIHTVLRHWREAEKWLHEAYTVFVELRDYDGEAQTLGNLGSMFYAKRDMKQAAAHLHLAADRFHLVGNDEHRSDTLIKLTFVRLRQFRFPQALVAYQAALVCRPNPTAIQRLLRRLLARSLRTM